MKLLFLKEKKKIKHQKSLNPGKIMHGIILFKCPNNINARPINFDI
ncbi:hypothetical protein BpHYR1_038231 [Brachionus plicatilis]|uniref:Uncharacterized protein n=1 Tax=Brachionus plicatilis TaxID=10195 RepID=A0A3M7PDJ2_BRAPC|nr:hypothetical protein BpHYR1_038231 [Brachionus plicatilis]